MMTLNNTISIDQPVHLVYNFMNTFENLPKWNYYIRKVERVKDSSTPRLYHQMRLQTTEYFEVKALIPNELITIETSHGSKNYFKRSTELHANGTSTLITDQIHLETPAPSILENLFSKKITRSVYENLTKLKELLETGITTLQDGRNVLLSQSMTLQHVPNRLQKWTVCNAHYGSHQ